MDSTQHGGSTITGWQYRMKTTGGGYGSWTAVTGGATASSRVVDGLANGRAYTFQVRAITTNTEVIGTAFESEPVTPSAVPPAPTVTATAGNMMVTLGWTAGCYWCGGGVVVGRPGYRVAVPHQDR